MRLGSDAMCSTGGRKADDFTIAPKRSAPLAIECTWSQHAFDPAAMLAFRAKYPQGENLLVAADVVRASTRRISGLDVRVVNLSHLAEHFAVR
jgi:hypothetical protein